MKSEAPILVKDGWFSESEVMWPGQKFCLKVEEILHQGKSKFQDVLVFKSSTYGNVLVLDGVIQLTERDEHAYQEMITHIPMFAHSNPTKVLIVGGGDGGVLREVAKHKGVEKIVMCEIDEEVIKMSKKYFSNIMGNAFEDPRLNLIIDDAAVFLANYDGNFDVIIVDSSDPVGPADVLYSPAFYQSMQRCLSPTGIICTQGECIWLHLDLIKKVMSSCSSLFPAIDYAFTTIPTYPSGQIGFILCSSDEDQNLCTPARSPSQVMQSGFRYYNHDVHRAAFILPQFAENIISIVRKQKAQSSSKRLKV